MKGIISAMASKKIAISQSNYLPWRGYFDLIDSVDAFLLYDIVQFTKNDWRNRNKILTPFGVKWLTIPVGQKIDRRICDVDLPDTDWREKHIEKLYESYKNAPNFQLVMSQLEPVIGDISIKKLSDLNRRLIEKICQLLRIETVISEVNDRFLEYTCPSRRLVEICKSEGAREYCTGPNGLNYLNLDIFAQEGITVTVFEYQKYTTYKQLWADSFEEGLSVADYLFCANGWNNT